MKDFYIRDAATFENQNITTSFWGSRRSAAVNAELGCSVAELGCSK
jgi:hypothetical protein